MSLKSSFFIDSIDTRVPHLHLQSDRFSIYPIFCQIKRSFMAAAEFYGEAEVDMYGKTQFTRPTPEENLEAQAKDIDTRILLLQANIRGFLSRQRYIFSINMPHRVNGRHGEKSMRPRTGEGILETKHHFLQNFPGLGVSDNI